MSKNSQRPKGYLGLLKQYPQFRKLFTARAVSLLGDWLNLLALLALLRELGMGNPQVLGGLFILKLLPNFLVSPIVGVVVDRYPRQMVMMVSDLIRFGLVLAFFLAPVFGSGATWFILSLTALQAAASAFFEPAKASILPDLVHADDLAPANALSALTWSVAYAVGSALGGLITFLVGWRLALVLDAASYLVSAWLVLSIRPVVTKEHDSGVKKDPGFFGLSDLAEVWRFLRHKGEIVYTMLLKSAWAMSGAIPLLLTLYGERKYNFGGRPDIGTAYLFACRAIGTGLGPVIGERIFPRHRRGLNQAIWWSLGFGSVFYMTFGTLNNPYFAGMAVVLAHIGGSIVWVFSTIRLQQIVPPRFRGRVFATEMGLATLMISLSSWGTGWLANSAGLPLSSLAFLLGGLLGVNTLVFWSIGFGLLRLHKPDSENRDGVKLNMARSNE